MVQAVRAFVQARAVKPWPLLADIIIVLEETFLTTVDFGPALLTLLKETFDAQERETE